MFMNEINEIIEELIIESVKKNLGVGFKFF